nr:GNAT family N-acetyltransferase [Planococcus glaciei]
MRVYAVWTKRTGPVDAKHAQADHRLEAKGHSAIFIAILNGEHVGYLMLIGNDAKRAAHRAALILGVQKSAQNKGIATSLLQKAEEWSAAKGVTRLELTVVEENNAARKLYDKSGYEKEGVRKKSLIIDDKPYDELLYGEVSGLKKARGCELF